MSPERTSAAPEAGAYAYLRLAVSTRDLRGCPRDRMPALIDPGDPPGSTPGSAPAPLSAMRWNVDLLDPVDAQALDL